MVYQPLVERPTRDELFKLYWAENKSLTDIARLYRVTRASVRRWIKNMTELMSSSIKKMGPEGLRKLYLGENKSLGQIALMYGVSSSTVKKWAKIYQITKREPRHRILNKPSRDEMNKLYWSENKSTLKIARLYGVHPNTIITWMKKHGLARRDRKVALKLMARPFVPNPGPALAYVLGVLLGDGSVYVRKRKSGKRTYHTQLCVKDKEFAKKFVIALKEIGLNPSVPHLASNGCYQVLAVSRNFYEWYKSLCFEDESPDLVKIRLVIKKFESQFVCGFYESEGSMSFSKSGKLRMRIGNRRGELLLMVQDILKCYGIKSSLCGPGKYNYFDLEIYGDERVNKLLTIIKPCIRTSPRVYEVSPKDVETGFKCITNSLGSNSTTL
ncbi:MAG: LAGLIDADG family homing endonuclease [Candidatus Hadarchaeota archaeon]